MKPIVINHFNRRKELIEMLAERGAKHGVEVGTDHGKYAHQLLEGVPTLGLDCIDPWVAYTEGDDVKTQEDVNKIYQEAMDTLSSYLGNTCTLWKMTSMEAVKEFEDNSLDFVFIDGNHEYEHVLEDITEWTKKVKPGGIVAGHDYKIDPVNNYGVIQAIQEYTEKNHIAPWFILHAGGTFVDCWMFIKQ